MKPMCERDKKERKEIAKNLGKHPPFTCKKCGAVAEQKKQLCKPEKK
jgi:uncharacterized Zn finger protein